MDKSGPKVILTIFLCFYVCSKLHNLKDFELTSSEQSMNRTFSRTVNVLAQPGQFIPVNKLLTYGALGHHIYFLIIYEGNIKMNFKLINERVYVIYALSKIFDLPARVVEQTEKIVADEFTVYDSCENLYIPHECVSIAVIMYICQTNNIELDAQLIDGFVLMLYSDQEEYQKSKKSIDRHYKRISRKYSNVTF